MAHWMLEDAGSVGCPPRWLLEIHDYSTVSKPRSPMVFICLHVKAAAFVSLDVHPPFIFRYHTNVYLSPWLRLIGQKLRDISYELSPEPHCFQRLELLLSFQYSENLYQPISFPSPLASPSNYQP